MLNGKSAAPDAMMKNESCVNIYFRARAESTWDDPLSLVDVVKALAPSASQVNSL